MLPYNNIIIHCDHTHTYHVHRTPTLQFRFDNNGDQHSYFVGDNRLLIEVCFSDSLTRCQILESDWTAKNIKKAYQKGHFQTTHPTPHTAKAQKGNESVCL